MEEILNCRLVQAKYATAIVNTDTANHLDDPDFQ